MRDISEILASIPMFNGLPKDVIKSIEAFAVKRAFEKGQTIFFEGEEADGLYIACSGLVKVYKLSADGKEQILDFVKPYETFAEVPVFSGTIFPANAEALQGTETLFLPRKGFLSLISNQPNIALAMLAILSERLRRFTIQVENLSLKEVPNRLASYFLYVSREEAKNEIFTLNISKGQLASLLGTIPETLSRTLRRMAEQGIIEVKGSRIHILDVLKLISLTEGEKLW